LNKLILGFLLFSSALIAQIISKSETPTFFIPEIFQDFPNVRDISISKNQQEIYFTVEGFRKEFSFIAVVRFQNGNWGKVKVVSFSGKDKDLEPFLSPDNLKLYFVSNRPVSLNIPKIDMDIWVVERKSIASKWSKPKNMGAVINTDKDEFYPSVTNSGNLYFTATYEDSKGLEDIYVSTFINGKYSKPVSLSTSVNSTTYEFNAFVSPNEDLILFTSYKREGSFGGGDLYMSKKEDNGDWSEAKNLGSSINSNKIDYCPFVNFKTNTLYFTSERSQQNKNFTKPMTIKELLNHMNSRPNGMSRIYKVEEFSKLIN